MYGATSVKHIEVWLKLKNKHVELLVYMFIKPYNDYPFLISTINESHERRGIDKWASDCSVHQVLMGRLMKLTSSRQDVTAPLP